MKKHLNTAASLPRVSLEETYAVVTAACSQDPTQVKDATDNLKALLERPGVLNCLHEISIQKTVPLLVRQQSIIQFKNNVGHWRSRRIITDEDRVQIRARTWVFLDEEDDTIFSYHQIIMTRIARSDYPGSWPALFPELTAIVNQGFEACYGNQANSNPPTLRLRRSLQILNALIKELSTTKIGLGLKNFSNITEGLHMILFNYYSNLASIITGSLTPEKLALPRTAEDIVIGHLVYKCLVRMACWIWQRIEQEAITKYQGWFQEFFKSSAFQMQSLFQQRIGITTSLAEGKLPTNPGITFSVDKLTRHIRAFGKFFRRVQQLNSKNFVLLPMCTDIVLYYWTKVVQSASAPPGFIADSQTAVFPTRFLVQAMVLFRESLAQWTPVRKDGTPNENTLTKDFVNEAVKLLLTRFILLTPEDLENWSADAEEWSSKEQREDDFWEFELRPCAERVLLTLSSQYKDYVSALLKEIFDDLVGRTAVELHEIIAKEAVYCAVGRCCLRLKDVIPFEQSLQQVFIAEAQNPNPSYPIIKRRVAWLIGKWVGDGCSPANNQKIWDVLVHLLQDHGPGTDIAVRLAAAAAIRGCVDALTFDISSFEPFIATAVPQLLRLISELDTLECKNLVIHSLNVVIEHSETRITPFIDAIGQQIPQLWANAGDSGEGTQLKSSLVNTVIAALNAIKENSARLVDLVVPLVRECLSPQASLHFDKDGISLWLVALRNSGPIQQTNGNPPGLFNLLPVLVTVLANNVDLLGSVIDIATSYYLLNATYVLQLCAVDLFRAYNQAFNSAVPLNTKDLLLSLNILFQLAPSSVWGEQLHISGLFATMLKNLLNEDDKLSAILITEYIYVFSRIAYSDRQMFLQLISATSAAIGTPESKIWEGMLDQWWTRFDNMSEPKHRKLTAMGIASLVSTGRPEVLNRIPSEIANLWLDVFGEIKEQQRLTEEGDSSPILSLYWDQPFSAIHSKTEGTPEHSRHELVFNNDPVRTLQLTSFIQACLQQAEVACGGAQVFQERYLSKMDPTVLSQIQKTLKG